MGCSKLLRFSLLQGYALFFLIDSFLSNFKTTAKTIHIKMISRDEMNATSFKNSGILGECYRMLIKAYVTNII